MLSCGLGLHKMPISEKRNIKKVKLKGRREDVKEASCSKYFSPTYLEM